MSLVGKKGVDISSLNGDVSIEKIKQAGYEFNDHSEFFAKE